MKNLEYSFNLFLTKLYINSDDDDIETFKDRQD